MKYHLDKSSKKFICPSCNKKRFVRFVEIGTGMYLNKIYGRCDRETSCGYYKKPIIDNDTKKNVQQKFFFVTKSIKNTSYHPLDILQKSLQQYHKNNFFVYLNLFFEENQIKTIFNKYKIGTSKAWEGSTVFWQIDNCNKIRAGKIILFDKETCKRVREPFPHITWVHSILKQNEFNLKQCLFGLHLAKESNRIAITESEKTAILMSLFLPEYVWLATGSKQNLKEELLLPIKNKEIIAFPDKSEYEDWQQKADELNKIGYNIKVSNYIENIDCNSGTDLADIYLSTVNNRTCFEELSKDEKEVVKLSKINSNLLLLIDTFGLCDSFDNQFNLEKLKKYV